MFMIMITVIIIIYSYICMYIYIYVVDLCAQFPKELVSRIISLRLFKPI